MKRLLNRLAFSILLIASALHPPLAAELKISTDFEGASARVLKLDQANQHIVIEPAGDPNRGMPNWWFLRVDGIDPAKPLKLEVSAIDVDVPFGKPSAKKLTYNWTLPDRAAVSADGKTWMHSEPSTNKGKTAIYTLTNAPATLWIAWGPPFTPLDAKAFVERIAQEHDYARPFILAKSLEGRDAPALLIRAGTKPAAERPAIWIHARQHAWECGGSWVGVGLVEWLVSFDARAKWLRENTEIYFVPVMDMDQVATGDGGKHAQPQDHNQDWIETPHWPEVVAAQQRIAELVSQRRMAFALDLHNPSPGMKQMSFYVLNDVFLTPQQLALKKKFIGLMGEQFGEIKIYDNSFPPGVDPTKLSAAEVLAARPRGGANPWIVFNGNPDTLALVVETPWNLPQGTTDGYRAVGKKLGIGIWNYLAQ